MSVFYMITLRKITKEKGFLDESKDRGVNVRLDFESEVKCLERLLSALVQQTTSPACI